MSLTEIIVNLIDNASAQFGNISQSAQATFDQIEGSTASASESMDQVGNAADNVGNSLGNIDAAPLDDVDNAANTASTDMDGLANAGESAGNALDSIESTSLDQAGNAASNAADGMDEMANAGEQAGNALDSVSSTSIDQAGNAASTAASELDKVGDSASKAADQVEQVGDAANQAGSDSVVGLGMATAAIGTLTAGAELAAQQLEKTNASFAKMSNVTLPEAELRNMVATLVSATFPTEDALLYIKTLKQIGVTAPQSLESGASAFNKISVATGVSSDEVVKFSNSMVAMGMNMEDIPSAYNAIAYANANMVGGFQTYVNWMQKYDSTFKEMGLNVDQTAVLISGATKKFGGGRAAYTGLNQAIKESNGDLTVLEQKLGMQPGSLANAEQATAAYTGKIEANNQIMGEHTTWLQRAKAEVERIGVEYGGVLGPVMSFAGALGGMASTIGTAITMKAALATATNTQVLAQNAESAATGVNTAATNTNILSKMRARIAGAAHILMNYSSAASLEVAAGAAAAHAGAVTMDTAAENQGLIAKARNTLSTIAGTVATGAKTVATGAATAAQWALNAAMNANPIGLIVIAILALIAVLGYLYYNNETVRNAINGLWNNLKGFAAFLWDGLMAAWNGLIEILSPVIDALGRLWAAISTVWDAWSDDRAGEAQGIFGAISEAVMAVWGYITELASALWEYLGPALSFIAEIMSGFLGAALETIMGILGAIIGHIARVIGILTDLILGNITFSEAMTQVWNSLWIMMGGIFNSILSGVGAFALGLIQWGLNAATGFVNNIINWFASLPGRAQAQLLFVIARVLAWATLMRARAEMAGREFLNGLIQMIAQAPGRVGTELWNIVNKIASFGGQLYQKAVDLGNRIKDGLMDALGIHSPGDMYRAIEGELGIIDSLMQANQDTLGANAESLGASIKDGFGTPELAVNVTAQDTPEGLGVNVPSPQMDPTLLLQNSEQTKGILAGTETFAQETMNGMNNTIRTSLTTMAATNTTAFQNITTTTRTGLAAVRQDTTREVGNVRSSWQGMQTALVGSAQTIKSQVTSSITGLTRNLATFWSRIQNPRTLVAGGYAGHPSLARAGGGGHAAGFNPFRDDRLMALFPTDEQCKDPEACFAGWDYTDPWVRSVMGEVGDWQPTFSSFGNLGLRVSDFKNSSFPANAKGNLTLFTALAERLIGPTSYDFYYNGRYSNAEALSRGAFNCWDGAEIMVSLAQALGLNAHMVHGHWGSIGHMAAMVEGQIFDTTQRQNRGVWRGTPGVSFGPGPALVEPDMEEATVKVEEEFNLNLLVDLRNVPSNMDEASLKAVVKETVKDEGVIKQIVKSRKFKDTLSGELGKGVIKAKRKKGA